MLCAKLEITRICGFSDAEGKVWNIGTAGKYLF
jgi:hypothetical protein